MKESMEHIYSPYLKDFKIKMVDYHLMCAKLYSQLSASKRLKCGAVLVTPDNTRILMCGYNGTLPGRSNICEKDDSTLDEVIHAEQNVLISCAKYGISTESCILYITHSPCINCAKLIIAAGISKVFFNTYYRDTNGLELLLESNIEYYKRNYSNKLLRS